MNKTLTTIMALTLTITMLIGTTAFADASTSMYMKVTGHATPTIIFDSGYSDGITTTGGGDGILKETWGKIVPYIKGARTVEFDRIGIGQSIDEQETGRTAIDRANQLHKALKAQGIKGPYILVAHSYGGYSTRAFAALYPSEVYGTVLVDCTGDGQSKFQFDWFKTYMPDFWPMIESNFTSADGTVEDVLATEAQMSTLPNGLQDKPLVVFTSTESSGIPALDEMHFKVQDALAQLSNKSTHIITQTGHYIHQSDKSGLIVDEINKMIMSYKAEVNDRD